jgi:RNA polymerase sigma-70 factor (ECF subfamily)
MTIPESQLVEQAAKGDKAAFGSLYERYLDEIYRYVYFRLFDHQEAEDLTETTFLKAWEALPKSRKKIKNFRAWIYRIARNLIIDDVRKKRPEILEDDAVAQENHIQVESILEEKQESQALVRALAQLEYQYRQVIVLRFFNQVSHAEVADILDIDEGHVRVLQYRGLKRLRQLLEKGSPDDG